MFTLFKAHDPEKHIFSGSYPFWPNREQAPGLKRLKYKTYLCLWELRRNEKKNQKLTSLEGNGCKILHFLELRSKEYKASEGITESILNRYPPNTNITDLVA